MCVTDRHDMTIAVKVVLNPDTTNQPIFSRSMTQITGVAVPNVSILVIVLVTGSRISFFFFRKGLKPSGKVGLQSGSLFREILPSSIQLVKVPIAAN